MNNKNKFTYFKTNEKFKLFNVVWRMRKSDDVIQARRKGKDRNWKVSPLKDTDFFLDDEISPKMARYLYPWAFH